MANFIELTDAETAAKAGVGQDHKRKVKDNFTNLNARALALESGVLTFDHFVDDDGGGFSFQPGEYNTGAGITTPPGGWTDTWYVNKGRRWLYQGYDGTTRDGTIHNAAKPDQSVARVASIGTAGGRYANLYGLDRVRFDRVTKPILFTARAKLAADQLFLFGLRDGPRSELLTTDRNGIWLERVDGSNWRFVSYNGTRTNGSAFAKVTSGTWFEVKIEFTNTPSDRALCYVDSVLKETVTTNLPTTSALCFALLARDTFPTGGASGVVDYDRVLVECGGLADAA